MADIDMDAVIAELRKGWQQGDLGAADQPSGDVCLRGALCRVGGVFNAVGDLYRAALDAVHDQERAALVPIIREQFGDRLVGGDTGPSFTVVPSFNDHPDTTLDDVILVCEKARAEQ